MASDWSCLCSGQRSKVKQCWFIAAGHLCIIILVSLLKATLCICFVWMVNIIVFFVVAPGFVEDMPTKVPSHHKSISSVRLKSMYVFSFWVHLNMFENNNNYQACLCVVWSCVNDVFSLIFPLALSTIRISGKTLLHSTAATVDTQTSGPSLNPHTVMGGRPYWNGSMKSWYF